MMPDRRFKFGLVTHSMEVAEAVRTYSDSITEELIVRLVDLDAAIPTAEKLLREGVEVIGHAPLLLGGDEMVRYFHPV